MASPGSGESSGHSRFRPPSPPTPNPGDWSDDVESSHVEDDDDVGELPTEPTGGPRAGRQGSPSLFAHIPWPDSEDDDPESDPDYQDEPEEEDEDHFFDAEGGDSDDGGLEVELFLNNDDNDDGVDDEDEGQAILTNLTQQLLGGGRIVGLSRGHLLALLSNRAVAGGLDDDDDDDFGFGGWAPPPRRRQRTKSEEFPKIPSEKGAELMKSGRFGANEGNLRLRKRKHLARRMLDRELGIYTKSDRQRNQDLMAQEMIPSTQAEMIIHYDSPVYSGQFSDDGNFAYACGHDFKVRMYDTSNPYDWKHYKTVTYPFGQWTLTDASLSPDNRWLAYTSIQSNVCLAPTDPNDKGDPYTLNLAARAQGDPGGWRFEDRFGIWSVRFSGDGRELVAGTNNHSIIVYDIESRTVLHNVNGHEGDVNAVCFADKSSPHILYSGSDDTVIKVWDRRSMGDQREAGAFVGHVEGLTYIDSKGDGRYILSNGKDQMMKLWDLRMVMSTSRFRELNPTQHTRDNDFDYRWGTYRDDDWFPHPSGDNSVVTFRGHKVLRTLIRCHFSPPSSTNSRYVYSGSQDGKVWIYNMDGTVAGIIDVNEATRNSRPHERRFRHHGGASPSWRTCVRDASWHPNAPLLLASAWNGVNAAFGTCTVHSFNEYGGDEGEPKMGRSVDEELKRETSLFLDMDEI